jgi:hypothetical protein
MEKNVGVWLTSCGFLPEFLAGGTASEPRFDPAPVEEPGASDEVGLESTGGMRARVAVGMKRHALRTFNVTHC